MHKIVGMHKIENGVGMHNIVGMHKIVGVHKIEKCVGMHKMLAGVKISILDTRSQGAPPGPDF